MGRKNSVNGFFGFFSLKLWTLQCFYFIEALSLWLSHGLESCFLGGGGRGAALGAGQRAEPGSAARTCCEVGSPRWPESQTGLGGSSGLSLQQEVKTPRRAGTPGLWRQLWPGWTRVTGCLCGAGERAARASREASEGAPVPLGRLV